MGPIRPYLIFLLLAGNAIAADPLSLNEQHRLGAYLAYVVSSVKPSEQEEVLKAGMTCPNCGGRGATGDGKICSTCDWVSPDGLLACKGTGKLVATGVANDQLLEDDYEELTERLEASGGFTEEMKEFSEAIENVADDWNESTVRDLGCKLQDVLEAKEASEPPAKDIMCLKGNAWTFEDKRIREATNAEMIDHLVTVHDIDSDSAIKMDREELIALHNLLHNSEVRASAPSSSCPSGSCPTSSSRSSGSSCPSGNCPTSSSGGSSRRGLFGRRR